MLLSLIVMALCCKAALSSEESSWRLKQKVGRAPKEQGARMSKENFLIGKGRNGRSRCFRFCTVIISKSKPDKL